MEIHVLNFKKVDANPQIDEEKSDNKIINIKEKKEKLENKKNEKDKNNESNKDKDKKKKNGSKFPTAYAILLLIQIFVFIISFFIPKGKFNMIEYSNGNFVVHIHGKDDITINATQSTLDEYKIKIPLNNFLKGYIKNPTAIPGTYRRIKNKFSNPSNILIYIIKGLIESADISFFIMILGGVTAILTEMNALNAGITALTRVTKRKEFLLLCIIFVIISIGGTTFGMAEEIFGFYPILMPIFLKSGLDGLLSTACLFLGSCIGVMFSTVNAFSVVLASYSAGVNFADQILFRIICLIIGDIITILYFYYYYRKVKKDETKSIVYEIREELNEMHLNKEEKNKNKIVEDEEKSKIANNKEGFDNKDEFTLRQKIALIIFALGFIVMVLGVVLFNWWFEQMSSLFVLIAIILMFLSKLGEENSVKVFLKGMGEFCSVALIIGIAKGINNTLEYENVSYTILNSLTKLLNGLSKAIFSIIMFIIFIVIGIFIQSTSGLAVLAMPIMAPLADQVNCNRNVVVNAYLFGQALVSLMAPTGYILIILQLVRIQYNYWIKFIWPLILILFIYLLILIILNSIIYK